MNEGMLLDYLKGMESRIDLLDIGGRLWKS